MKFRALTSKDELLLWRFLALGTGLSKTEVANHPVWSRYGEGWGRDGDFALAASKLRDNERHDVGLIWSRLYSKNHAGFGFIAPDIPEMCLFAESAPDLKKLRGQLLGAYLDSLAHRFDSVSTHFDSHDLSSLRLYQNAGFHIIEESADGLTKMLLVIQR